MHFFGRSGLPTEVLAKVWGAVDAGQQGFLAREDFGVAMRAVAVAQSGSIPAAATVRQLDLRIPPPKMRNLLPASTRALRGSLSAPPHDKSRPQGAANGGGGGEHWNARAITYAETSPLSLCSAL